MRTWLALIAAPSLALGCLSVNYALVSLVRVSAAANAAVNDVSVASLVGGNGRRRDFNLVRSHHIDTAMGTASMLIVRLSVVALLEWASSVHAHLLSAGERASRTSARASNPVRKPWTRVPWRVLTMPLVARLLHAVVLWGWHAPVFFEAALARRGIHTLQHTSFLMSALLFWWTVFGNTSRGERSAHALLSLFTTMVHTGALGALLTLAPGLWYPSYIETTSALGFDPLQDQQLGGLVMWVPGGIAYLIGGLAVGARWLTRRPPPPSAKRGDRNRAGVRGTAAQDG